MGERDGEREMGERERRSEREKGREWDPSLAQLQLGEISRTSRYWSIPDAQQLYFLQSCVVGQDRDLEYNYNEDPLRQGSSL